MTRQGETAGFVPPAALDEGRAREVLAAEVAHDNAKQGEYVANGLNAIIFAHTAIRAMLAFAASPEQPASEAASEDVAFLRDLAGRLFRTGTPAMGFDQGDTDQLYRIAAALAERSTRVEAEDCERCRLDGLFHLGECVRREALAHPAESANCPVGGAIDLTEIDAVIAEMIEVAVNDGDDSGWLADFDRGDVDRWQARLQVATGHANGFPSRPARPTANCPVGGEATARCYTIDGPIENRRRNLTEWVRRAMRFVDLCDADAGGYADLHDDAKSLTEDGYMLFGADIVSDGGWCLADLEHRTLTALMSDTRSPADATSALPDTEREEIERAIRATEYKYFGDYEMGDDQREAVDQLVLTAQRYLALPPAGAGAEEARYLIRKGGHCYRPNAQGYTSHKAEAGRYTLADAIAYSHPNGPDGPRDGIDYMLADATDGVRDEPAGDVGYARGVEELENALCAQSWSDSLGHVHNAIRALSARKDAQ